MKNKRTKTKTEVISHTVKPIVKQSLAVAAEQENRSKANMLEVMILEYCNTHNIRVQIKKDENGTK